MNTVYTTTITDKAAERGINVEVIDPELPVFLLSYKGKNIRCYNSLTDKTGAASFHLANVKSSANYFLRKKGFPVPAQASFTSLEKAINFLDEHKCIVVKPCTQWGGRGVSTHIRCVDDLKKAIRVAKRFCDSIVLEECVEGIDWRLIFVNYKFVTAIQRNPASIESNGKDSIRTLINKKNAFARKNIDKSNIVPLDKETQRCIKEQGLTYDSVPDCGIEVQVRWTTNFHTGGTVDIVTDIIPDFLSKEAQKIAQLFQLAITGIDFLFNPENGKYYIIEVSPDLAISPPEGDMVAEAFLDYLFPESSGAGNLIDKETKVFQPFPV
jgi:D-alanine-D-alanine ligase-like ATP-grasp enzyme